MDICIVTQQFRNIYSGIGLHANILANYLLTNGHSITLVVPEHQQPNSKPKFIVEPVKVREIFKNQARWFSLCFSFSKTLKQLEKTRKFDIIHFTDARESILSRSVNSAIVGNINDTYSADLQSISYYKKYYQDWLQRWAYYFLVHTLEKRYLSRLDYIIANSRFTYETIRKRYAPETSLTICYKSIDKNRYSVALQERLEKKNNDSNPTILFVGGNMQRKGVATIIDAAPEIIRRLPEVKFIIVGNDKAIKGLKKKCNNLNIAPSFEFPGWCSQDEILSFHKKATLFVMPSLTEALGVALLEAMASGIPVIGTNVGGIPEIIHHGVNGSLVSPDSPDELSAAILQLLTDKHLQEKYRNSALKTVERFSINKMMECTIDVYKQAINTKKNLLNPKN